MLILKNIDAIVIDSKNYFEALRAINVSKKQIEFGNIFFFTDVDKDFFDGFDIDKINFIKIQKINNLNDYNNFCLRIANYSDNDFAMIIHHDGFVMNTDIWSNNFLDYDYIGAPWPLNLQMQWGVPNRVGNGGFSLRSKKLLNLINRFESTYGMHEDMFISNGIKDIALSEGIKYCDPTTAMKFSFELSCHDLDATEFNPNKHFGFHGQYDNRVETVYKFLEKRGIR